MFPTNEINKINSDILKLQVEKKNMIKELEEIIIQNYTDKIIANKDRMKTGDIGTTIRDLVSGIKSLYTL